ncbi:hypothetical protein [Roseiconus lacunae]|uniref:hypothetical protein n=1 Tax=Roseiconus lacunae TaxID=2605694 RepID=UPI0011F3B488|nr:hypothetical protein [Roseiconus lacunae]WRQ50929.1 hypothetical protein U8335_28780 [Stieleria sp. HD01]
MAQNRVAFIPWNENQAGNFKTEYEQNNAQKGASHHKRTWTMVYLDSPGTPLAALGCGFGTRIHIAGHGDIGDPEIAADHGTGGADRSYTEVVDMMIAKGLKKRYLGTIACDVCYSALGNPSFAKLMARELFSRGLKASCVLGYKGSLYATYDSFYADGSNMGGKYSHRMVELDDGTEVKSKKAQERFFGWT